MRPSEASVLTVAEIVRDSAAMNEAALAGDFDEARFRAHVISSKARELSLRGVALAASHLIDILGKPAREPNAGVGAAMVWLADELDKVSV